MIPQTREAPCIGCGATQTREVAEGAGAGAAIMNAMELWCVPCSTAEDERERTAEREAAAEHQLARARTRQRKSGIPEHLWSFRFSSITGPDELGPALDLARRWGRGDALGAMLGGPSGAGKTRLAVAASNMMLAYRQVRWYSAPLLLARLGSGGFDSPPRVAALEALTGSDALVLDDLDKARATEYAAEIVFLAVDARCDGAAPLLVTTNLAPGELAERWPQPYGEAIASRLGLLPAAHVEGPDRRIRAPGL